jgi:hypothetical protein
MESMRQVNRSKRQTCLLLPKRVCWKSGPESNKRLYYRYLTRSHYLSDPDPESWIHTCNNIVADPLSFCCCWIQDPRSGMEKNVRIGIKTMDPKHWLVIKNNRSTPWIIGLPDLNPESKLGLQCANPGLHGSQSFSGCGSSTHPPVLRIRNIYPCFRIKLFFISDPGSKFFSIPDPHQSILTQKNCFLSSRIYDQGSSSKRILIFTHLGSRIQGSKRHRIPDAQHWQPHYKVQIIIITKKVYALFACRAANADLYIFIWATWIRIWRFTE